jgi:hypothetical protein
MFRGIYIDAKLNKLGAMMAKSLTRAGENLACREVLGLTLEDMKLFEENLLNPERDMMCKFICTWARKNYIVN